MQQLLKQKRLCNLAMIVSADVELMETNPVVVTLQATRLGESATRKVLGVHNYVNAKTVLIFKGKDLYLEKETESCMLNSILFQVVEHLLKVDKKRWSMVHGIYWKCNASPSQQCEPCYWLARFTSNVFKRKVQVSTIQIY